MANDNTIDYVIGMPPDLPSDDAIGTKTNTVMRNSMPLVRIYPGIPSFTKGLSLFTRRAKFKSNSTKDFSYTNLLADHGFYLSPDVHNNCISIAYQADSFPTDSFTNEYGENFLQSFTDVSSQAAASLAQIFGARSGTEAFRSLTGQIKKEGKLGEMVGTGLEQAAKTAGNLINAIPGVGTGVNLASALAAGSRLDFPMVWKTSGFQPSYSMTIRLYNPSPGSARATKKYIAAPIAALMLLGIPISEDGVTYSWPFIHRIWSPGIYDLDPAFISNITIIKGGDQQQIGYTQRLGIVDVRIDFGSLFSSILATKSTSRTRPTLKRYIDGISGSDAQKTGVRNFSTVGQTQEEIDARRDASTTTNTNLSSTKNQAPTTDDLTTEEKQNPPDRVATEIKNVADDLISQIPGGFNISVD
jgi:hypothetical protein